jgi:hypothetical protein
MSILKRDVYFDNTGGFVRFWDWAICTTTLGSMAEPFQPDARYGFGPQREFDPTDELARIDSLQAAPIDTQLLVLSGGVNQLIGGTQNPRIGR